MAYTQAFIKLREMRLKITADPINAIERDSF